MRISDWSSDVCSSDLWHRCDICLAISLSWRKGSLQAAYTNGIDRHLISARQSEENAVRLIEFCCRGVQAGTRPLNNSSTVSINWLLDVSRGFEDVAERCSDQIDHGDEGMGVSVARSEEHTSELQSLLRISYAVFCLKKKKELQ